jgi:hypothetical protein
MSLDLKYEIDKQPVRSEKRYKLIHVSPQIVLSLIGSPVRGTDDGATVEVFRHELPPDAVVEGVNYDPRCNVFLMRAWSASFPIVDEGHTIPALDVRVTKTVYRLAPLE